MIWLVRGSSGEYEDYSEWIAHAFTTEQAARDLCAKLQAISDSLDAPHFPKMMAADPRAEIDVQMPDYEVICIPVDAETWADGEAKTTSEPPFRTPIPRPEVEFIPRGDPRLDHIELADGRTMAEFIGDGAGITVIDESNRIVFAVEPNQCGCVVDA